MRVKIFGSAFRTVSVQSGVPKGRKFEPTIRNPRGVERLPGALQRPANERRHIRRDVAVSPEGFQGISGFTSTNPDVKVPDSKFRVDN
jgi:hypothetical protein